MTRREMLELLGKSATTGGLSTLPAASAKEAALAPPPSQLPGTDPLTGEGDLAAQMVLGIHRLFGEPNNRLSGKTTRAMESRLLFTSRLRIIGGPSAGTISQNHRGDSLADPFLRP